MSHSTTNSRLWWIEKFTLLFTISLFIQPFYGNVSAQGTSKYLIGVRPDQRSHYELPVGQQFKCLDGSGTVPVEFINDNYCDCRDASDEPGTSACPHGRFYCQNQGYLASLIPASYVNDGVCDCCDTTDEYNSTVPCENTCGVLGEIYRQEQEKSREIADRGAAIRSQYKEEAKQRKEQNTQLLDQYKRELREKEDAIKRLEDELNSDFGPSQVFLPLKGKCFAFTDHEYTYNLCPFDRASQESTAGMQTELGRWSGWAGTSDNPHSKQKYEGGIQCWNGPARSAVVNIECGVEDKVTSVTEPAKCEYVYNFITPAACPDLDPPEPTVAEGSADQQTSTEAPIDVTPPSLEVEGEHLNTDPPAYYHDDSNNEAPDGEGLLNGEEQHDEL